MWFCYILRCIDINHKNLTYNGKTNDLLRRIRQHNGEISGGAKATRGKKWEFYAIMFGFPNESNCMSCEYKIKKPTASKRRPAKYCGVNGRILGLNEVLVCNKWTSKCTVENKDSNFKLFLTDDVSDLIDFEIIPNNIEIYSVKKMGMKFLRNVMNGVY